MAEYTVIGYGPIKNNLVVVTIEGEEKPFVTTADAVEALIIAVKNSKPV